MVNNLRRRELFVTVRNDQFHIGKEFIYASASNLAWDYHKNGNRKFIVALKIWSQQANKLAGKYTISGSNEKSTSFWRQKKVIQ